MGQAAHAPGLQNLVQKLHLQAPKVCRPPQCSCDLRACSYGLQLSLLLPVSADRLRKALSLHCFSPLVAVLIG